jgi:hypothetical protein
MTHIVTPGRPAHRTSFFRRGQSSSAVLALLQGAHACLRASLMEHMREKLLKGELTSVPSFFFACSGYNVLTHIGLRCGSSVQPLTSLPVPYECQLHIKQMARKFLMRCPFLILERISEVATTG